MQVLKILFHRTEWNNKWKTATQETVGWVADLFQQSFAQGDLESGGRLTSLLSSEGFAICLRTTDKVLNGEKNQAVVVDTVHYTQEVPSIVELASTSGIWRTGIWSHHKKAAREGWVEVCCLS